MTDLEKRIVELHNQGMGASRISRLPGMPSARAVSTLKTKLKLNSLGSKVKIDELKILLEKGLNDKEIAEMLNVTRFAISSRRRQLGKTLTNEEVQARATKAADISYYDIFQDKELLSILVGTLLGDASLTITSKTSARGSCHHKIDNEDYLLYKASKLAPIVSQISYRETKEHYLHDIKVAKCAQVGLKLKSSPFLKRLHGFLYNPSGKKIITSELLNYFDNSSLAMHFFDDGYTRHPYRCLVITNYSLDADSRKLYAEFLKQKFNLNARIWINGFAFINDDAYLLKEIIEEFATPSMQYKLSLPN